MTKMHMNKFTLKDFLLITLGVTLVAISLEYFFVPNNIAAGGVSGMAIIINDFIPLLSVGAIVLIINIILFTIAFFVLDSSFGAKTFYSTFALAVIMSLMDIILKPKALTDDLFINAAIGTLIGAIGMAVVFNAGGSTGGTDIIAKMLNKYLHLEIGQSLLVVDFAVGIFGIATFGITAGLYAMLAIVIHGTLIDRLIDGFNTSKEIMIISKNEKEIVDFILNNLDRSCTILNGYGAYTREDTQVLYVVLIRRDYIKLKNFIKEIDPKAFISVNEVHEVLGEGFKDIKM